MELGGSRLLCVLSSFTSLRVEKDAAQMRLSYSLDRLLEDIRILKRALHLGSIKHLILDSFCYGAAENLETVALQDVVKPIPASRLAEESFPSLGTYAPRSPPHATRAVTAEDPPRHEEAAR